MKRVTYEYSYICYNNFYVMCFGLYLCKTMSNFCFLINTVYFKLYINSPQIFERTLQVCGFVVRSLFAVKMRI